jgi:hypothetical protein
MAGQRQARADIGFWMYRPARRPGAAGRADPDCLPFRPLRATARFRARRPESRASDRLPRQRPAEGGARGGLRCPEFRSRCRPGVRQPGQNAAPGL